MRTVDPTQWMRQRSVLISNKFGQPVSLGFEYRLRRTLTRVMKEYGRNSSLRIVQYLLGEYETKFEERFWLLIFLVWLFMGIPFVVWSIMRAGPRPTISVPFQEHSIGSINFPAVALCSYSVLSKNAIWNYTYELYEKDHEHQYSVEQIFNNLQNFGSLVDFTLPDVDLEFQPFLERVDPERGNNVSKIMYRLSEPCNKQLHRCSWHGKIIPCEELFQLRTSSLGLCCTFNGRFERDDFKNPPKVLSSIGQDLGLSVVVKRHMDDFAYVRKLGIGTEVLLFESSEYPLLEGGAVRSYSAFLNVSVYIVLSAIDQVIEPDVEYVPESRRGCRLRQTSGGVHTSDSSYAWCLTMCRRFAIKQLCGCVPFFLMPRPDSFICSPNQLACLNKYKEKLLFYDPSTFTDEVSGLIEEIADSLDCEKCIPDCTRVRYSSNVYKSSYYDAKRIFTNYFTRGEVLRNTTVIRIFYSNEDQQLYQLEITEKWYQTIGNLGSVWFFLLGLSMTVLPELIFHLTIRAVAMHRQQMLDMHLTRIVAAKKY